jgi:uncharacterized integral membrane protein
MIFPLILGIVLGAFSIIFALQNITPVTLTFFSWQFQGSLALVLLLAAGVGIVTSLLVVLPETISSYFSYRRLQKANVKLEEELRKQKELTAFAKKTPPSLEELSKHDKDQIIDPIFK